MSQKSHFNIEALIEERPKLHFNSKGERVSWGITPEVLLFLRDIAKAGDRTIETGAGLSTICLTGLHCRHTSIMPDARIKETVLEKCADLGLSAYSLNFIIEKSQDYLPSLGEDEFDIVLIDGDHAFPMPFFDYYYLGKRLKVGGVLIIDDTLLWTGEVLKDFLMLEPEWEYIKNVSNNASAFKKLKTTATDKGWGGQAYQVVKSKRVPPEVAVLHREVLEKSKPEETAIEDLTTKLQQAEKERDHARRYPWKYFRSAWNLRRDRVKGDQSN